MWEQTFSQKQRMDRRVGHSRDGFGLKICISHVVVLKQLVREN